MTWDLKSWDSESPIQRSLEPCVNYSLFFFASELPSEIEKAKIKIEKAKTCEMGGNWDFFRFRRMMMEKLRLFLEIQMDMMLLKGCERGSSVNFRVFFLISKPVFLHCNFKKSPAGQFWTNPHNNCCSTQLWVLLERRIKPYEHIIMYFLVQLNASQEMFNSIITSYFLTFKIPTYNVQYA